MSRIDRCFNIIYFSQRSAFCCIFKLLEFNLRVQSDSMKRVYTVLGYYMKTGDLSLDVSIIFETNVAPYL